MLGQPNLARLLIPPLPVSSPTARTGGKSQCGVSGHVKADCGEGKTGAPEPENDRAQAILVCTSEDGESVETASGGLTGVEPWLAWRDMHDAAPS
jgi:hypothetical protein